VSFDTIVTASIVYSPRVWYIVGSGPDQVKYWFARNQDNVSEWGDMSIRGLLLQ